MSEVYLTKVERKTIFTQGLIYVLFMFVISDLMVVGPLWFKLFPWIYVLGLVSKSKFSKPVLALVIASFTTFISAILKTRGLTLEVFIVTLNSIFMVTAGVITGTYIFDLKLNHRLVKFIPKGKKVYMLLVSVFITVIVVAVNSYINGDVYSYFKNKKDIAEFVIKQYNEEKFEIKQVKYELVNFVPQYSYDIEISGVDVHLIYGARGKIEDINMESRIEKSEEELNKLLQNETGDLVNNNKYVLSSNIDYKLNFSQFFLKPNKLQICIQTKFEEKEKEKIYGEIISCIKEIDSLKCISIYEHEYVITCGEKVTNIKQKNIKDLTMKYLEDSFTIDELSQI